MTLIAKYLSWGTYLLLHGDLSYGSLSYKNVLLSKNTMYHAHMKHINVSAID